MVSSCSAAAVSGKRVRPYLSMKHFMSTFFVQSTTDQQRTNDGPGTRDRRRQKTDDRHALHCTLHSALQAARWSCQRILSTSGWPSSRRSTSGTKHFSCGSKMHEVYSTLSSLLRVRIHVYEVPLVRHVSVYTCTLYPGTHVTCILRVQGTRTKLSTSPRVLVRVYSHIL